MRANKKLFIRILANYLVENQGAKSICLEMEQQRSPSDPRPKWADEWAKLRSVSPLSGYPDVDEAEKQLRKFLQ